jgi:hypothetical protein
MFIHFYRPLVFLSSKKLWRFRPRSMPFGTPEGHTTILSVTDHSGRHFRQMGVGPVNLQEAHCALTG